MALHSPVLADFGVGAMDSGGLPEVAESSAADAVSGANRRGTGQLRFGRDIQADPQWLDGNRHWDGAALGVERGRAQGGRGL